MLVLGVGRWAKVHDAREKGYKEALVKSEKLGNIRGRDAGSSASFKNTKNLS